MISLNSSLFLASGGTRDVFIHPTDSTKVIKVDKKFPEDIKPNNEVDFIYYRYLQNQKKDLSHIPLCYGWVETNFGKGVEFENIVNYDGSKALTLKYVMQNEILDYKIVKKLLDNLVHYLKENSILFIDNSFENILCQEYALNSYKLMIIDGLGARKNSFKFFLYKNFSFLARRKIDKHIHFIYENYYKLLNSSDSKNITHINFAKGFRGGERQTLLLIEELASQGYNQKLLTRQNSELATKAFKVKNLQIIEIAKPYIFHVSKIKESALLHAHETKAAQFAFLAHLAYKIPYIITRRVDNKIKNNFFTRAMYTKASCTVVLSNAIKEQTLKVSQDIHFKIIPSAYSKLQIDDKNAQKIKQRFQGKFLIGNIGELDNNHKGQYYLIEAAKMLQKTYPQFHFIFLGKGKDEENYKNQARDLTNITFEGFVDNVGDYIAAFDLFVFPSLHEGLGSILLDVMQAQVPIIATDVGGIPDLIEHQRNGLLIPPQNSDAIYESIVELYMQKEKREMLTINAVEKAQSNSPSQMAKQYLQLYANFKRE